MKKLVLTGFVLAIFVAVTVIFSVDGHCKEKYNSLLPQAALAELIILVAAE